MALDLSSLPDALASLFSEMPDGEMWGRFYSATEAREVEQALAEYGISYQTRIVRSRKRGLFYKITLLDTADDYAVA